jgi:peptide/nickel transport system substrate-binding protein
MSMIRFISPATIAGCLSVLAAALPGSASAQPQQDTLRIRLNADVRTLDPGVNRDSNTDMVQAHLFEGLVAFKEDTSVGPLLAQSVTTSPDGKVYTFKLRPGLKFSNGAPVTSAEVVSSWNRYMKPDTGWRCLTEFDGRGLMKVLKIEAKDPLTVVYTLDKPTGLFLTTLARPDCGGTGVFHPSSVGPDGKWKEPIATGPFKMGEWKRGQYLELLKNEHYVALPGKRDGYTGNKAPLVSKVRFAIIPDPSASKAALLSGGIDIIFDIEDEDAPEYRKRKDLVMDSVSTLGLNGILIQTKDPLMKDPRIRRAFALSLDVPQIVEAVTFGAAKPSRSALPHASPFYTAVQAAMPKRDVAAAKKLLKEAGYTGQPIKMMATKRYANVFNVAVMSQAMAQEAGFKVDIEVLDWATVQDRYLRGDYQIASHTFSARLDPSLSFEMFTGPKDTQPRKVWDNPQAIAEVTKSMEPLDKAARQAIFDKLEGQLREDVPTIWMYSEVRTSAARSYVKGYAGWPLGHARGWGVSMTAH